MTEIQTSKDIQALRNILASSPRSIVAVQAKSTVLMKELEPLRGEYGERIRLYRGDLDIVLAQEIPRVFSHEKVRAVQVLMSAELLRLKPEERERLISSASRLLGAYDVVAVTNSSLGKPGFDLDTVSLTLGTLRSELRAQEAMKSSA